MVTFNSPINFEVAETSRAAATLDGVLMTYDANGKLDYATAASGRYDAILISEIVDTATYKDRYYIYTTIDFGPYVQVAETISVAKGCNGMTANGIAVTATAAAITKGSQLEIGANGRLVVKAAGVAVAVAMEAIAQNAVKTGAVHFLV